MTNNIVDKYFLLPLKDKIYSKIKDKNYKISKNDIINNHKPRKSKKDSLSDSEDKKLLQVKRRRNLNIFKILKLLSLLIRIIKK